MKGGVAWNTAPLSGLIRQDSSHDGPMGGDGESGVPPNLSTSGSLPRTPPPRPGVSDRQRRRRGPAPGPRGPSGTPPWGPSAAWGQGADPPVNRYSSERQSVKRMTASRWHEKARPLNGGLLRKPSATLSGGWTEVRGFRFESVSGCRERRGHSGMRLTAAVSVPPPTAPREKLQTVEAANGSKAGPRTGDGTDLETRPLAKQSAWDEGKNKLIRELKLR